MKNKQDQMTYMNSWDVEISKIYMWCTLYTACVELLMINANVGAPVRVYARIYYVRFNNKNTTFTLAGVPPPANHRDCITQIASREHIITVNYCQVEYSQVCECVFPRIFTTQAV